MLNDITLAAAGPRNLVRVYMANIFLLVLPQRAGRGPADRCNPRPGLDPSVRSKERAAAPVIAAKARDFNLLSPTGYACPRSQAKPRSSRISRVHGILQRIARLEHRNRRGGDRQTFACPRVARGTRWSVPGDREVRGLVERVRDHWRRWPELGWAASAQGLPIEELAEHDAWREEGVALREAGRARLGADGEAARHLQAMPGARAGLEEAIETNGTRTWPSRRPAKPTPTTSRATPSSSTPCARSATGTTSTPPHATPSAPLPRPTRPYRASPRRHRRLSQANRPCLPNTPEHRGHRTTFQFPGRHP